MICQLIFCKKYNKIQKESKSGKVTKKQLKNTNLLLNIMKKNDIIFKHSENVFYNFLGENVFKK